MVSGGLTSRKEEEMPNDYMRFTHPQIFTSNITNKINLISMIKFYSIFSEKRKNTTLWLKHNNLAGSLMKMVMYKLAFLRNSYDFSLLKQETWLKP